MGTSNTSKPVPLFQLQRVAVEPEGCFGVLKHNRIPFAVTLERTYENPGEPVVKIPPGLFRCTRTIYYKRGYPTYEIRVFGHSRILFHKGNLETELDGCVAIGEAFDPVNGMPGIIQSGVGFTQFMTRAANAQEFYLEVA